MKVLGVEVKCPVCGNTNKESLREINVAKERKEGLDPLMKAYLCVKEKIEHSRDEPPDVRYTYCRTRFYIGPKPTFEEKE